VSWPVKKLVATVLAVGRQEGYPGLYLLTAETGDGERIRSRASHGAGGGIHAQVQVLAVHNEYCPVVGGCFAHTAVVAPVKANLACRGRSGCGELALGRLPRLTSTWL